MVQLVAWGCALQTYNAQESPGNYQEADLPRRVLGSLHLSHIHLVLFLPFLSLDIDSTDNSVEYKALYFSDILMQIQSQICHSLFWFLLNIILWVYPKTVFSTSGYTWLQRRREEVTVSFLGLVFLHAILGWTWLPWLTTSQHQIMVCFSLLHITLIPKSLLNLGFSWLLDTLNFYYGLTASDSWL